MSRHLLVVALVATLSLVGCGDGSEASLDPPDVRYNEDVSEMGMFVTDPRYTVAYLPEDGNWILFDDIGEMFRYRFMLHPDDSVRVIWVNDYLDEDWLRSEDAWYLVSTEIKTPMGWGIAAFRDESSARELQSDRGGEILSWAEVQRREWSAAATPAPRGRSNPTTPATPET